MTRRHRRFFAADPSSLQSRKQMLLLQADVERLECVQALGTVRAALGQASSKSGLLSGGLSVVSSMLGSLGQSGTTSAAVGQLALSVYELVRRQPMLPSMLGMLALRLPWRRIPKLALWAGGAGAAAWLLVQLRQRSKRS